MYNKNILYIIIISSIIFAPAAYILIAGLLIIDIAKKNKIVFQEIRNNKIYISLIVLIVITIIFSELWYLSLFFAILFFLNIYISAYTYTNFDITEFDNIKKIIYFTAIFVFIIGLVQYLNPSFSIPAKWVDYENYKITKRIYSTFSNPNIFGFFINLIIILACVELENKGKNYKIAAITGTIGLLCLVLTFSRTSWVSLCVSLLIVGVIINRKYIKYSLIIFVAIITIDFLLGSGRINPISAANDSGLMYRFEIWKSCIKVFLDYPITGIGFGALFDYICSYSDTISAYVEHPHNMYLHIAVETGLVGISIALFVFVNLIKKIKRRFESNRKDKIAMIAILLVTMTLINGISDSVLFSYQISLLASIFSGIVISTK